MLNQKQVETAFYKLFKPFAVEQGFTMTDKRLSQSEKKYDKKRVSMDVSFTAHAIKAFITYTTRLPEIEEILELFIDDTGFFGRAKGDFFTFNIPVEIAWPEAVQHKWYERGMFKVWGEEDTVTEFFELYKFIITEKMLPIWEKWQDVKELDKLFYGVNDITQQLIFGSGGDFFLRKIIIAKLAGNPQYEKVYSDVYELLAEEGKTDSVSLKYLPGLEKLHAYLETVDPSL